MPVAAVPSFRRPVRTAQTRTAVAVSMVAPTNGLNYRDPFIQLGDKDAVILDNFIPRQTGCEVRAGYKTHATGLAGSVNTMMVYYALAPNDDRLFACAVNGIYDVTTETGGNAGVWDAGAWDQVNWDYAAAPATTDSTDGVWSNVMFSAPTQNYLCCTSPSGGYWTYDATDGWIDRTASVTGMTAPMGCITSWKNRLFIVGEGTNTVSYLPVDSIQGATTELDLGPLMKHGGSIVAATSWTMNAGIDIDDYLVFFGSKGDIIVFQGTDPDDINSFALKGIWYAGRPVEGNRFFVSYGGDIIFMTEFGLFPLTKLVNGQVATEYAALSARIQPALSPLLNLLIDNEFWEVSLIENEDLLLLKMPRQNNDTYQQYVMNLLSGAWSTFSGMPINTQITFQGEMYFGDENGTVYHGLYGASDDAALNATGGVPILARAQGGFNDFGATASLKRFQMAYPIFIGEVAPAVQVQMNTQYSFNPIYSSPNYLNVGAAYWDTGNWDQCSWTGMTNTYAAWAGLSGMGYYGSLQVACRGKPGTMYVSTNVTIDVGGPM